MYGKARLYIRQSPISSALSGRGNHAQRWLKSRPGQRDSRRAAQREEARTASRKLEKSRSQQDGSTRSYLRDRD
jgi:hypothetical protein